MLLLWDNMWTTTTVNTWLLLQLAVACMKTYMTTTYCFDYVPVIKKGGKAARINFYQPAETRVVLRLL